jgi:hypothetical protein
MRGIGAMLFTLVCLWTSCTTTRPIVVEDQVVATPTQALDKQDKSPGTMILQKDAPNAVKILQESCPGGYVSLDDFSNPPSTEVGISHSISGETRPYTRYRCRRF